MAIRSPTWPVNTAPQRRDAPRYVPVHFTYGPQQRTIYLRPAELRRLIRAFAIEQGGAFAAAHDLAGKEPFVLTLGFESLAPAALRAPAVGYAPRTRT